MNGEALYPRVVWNEGEIGADITFRVCSNPADAKAHAENYRRESNAPRPSARIYARDVKVANHRIRVWVVAMRSLPDTAQ